MQDDSAWECLSSKTQSFTAQGQLRVKAIEILGGVMDKLLNIAYSGLRKGCELWWSKTYDIY